MGRVEISRRCFSEQNYLGCSISQMFASVGTPFTPWPHLAKWVLPSYLHLSVSPSVHQLRPWNKEYPSATLYMSNHIVYIMKQNILYALFDDFHKMKSEI